MYKNASYREKFADLKEWVPFIIESVKKDIKNDHLKKDLYFFKKYFATKNLHKLGTDELADAYYRAIQEEDRGEEIAEFIASRWLLRNSELYELFQRELSRINPEFADLDELDQPQAQSLIELSNREFGAPHTYLFAVLNSVVFPKESFTSLKKQAVQHQETAEQQKQQQDEKQTIDSLKLVFEREIARLTDKYEKKLMGLQKKYLNDTEGLKKQVSQLQRKLSEKGA
jgi:hypothetical protein